MDRDARRDLPPPMKTHRSILEAEIIQAEEELQRPAHGLLISGILAGLLVGISLFLMAVVLSLPGPLPEPLSVLLVANAFTVGFILLILARTDLFTEYTTIAILPVLTGSAATKDLARLWGLVYLGNMIGAIAFAALTVFLGPSLGVIDAESFGALAAPMTRHGALVTTGSALLAGWLMGVLSWLIAAGRETMSHIVFVWIVTFTIGLGGLHHAITGTAEVAAALIARQGVSLGDGVRFLAWTTLGNSAGGVLFAVLIRYSLVMRATDQDPTEDEG